MKERPILFSAPMVRAILSGSKTQTRRVVKLKGNDGIQPNHTMWRFCEFHGPEALWQHRVDLQRVLKHSCPYGRPGDQLWVRETWDFLPDGGPDEPNVAMIRYWAGSEMERRIVPADFNPMIYSYEKKRPSIHMPRWASRIQLEITNIRVERLQDCSEADAIAEGVVQEVMPPTQMKLWRKGSGQGNWHSHAVGAYRELWESINGPGSWDANPWVWVIEFRKLKP